MSKAKKSAPQKSRSREEMLRASAMAAVLRKGPQCSVCALSPKDRAMIVELRAEVPPISFRAIAKGFEQVGIRLDQQSIARHLRDHASA